ncbi:MAG: PAS domain S-box protein [Chloroflexi bacterium]|nr:PAS domain S-box protein [Chloroflexota bacterium]
MNASQDIVTFITDFDERISHLDTVRVVSETLCFITDELELLRSSIALLEPDRSGFRLRDVTFDVQDLEEGRSVPFASISISEVVQSGKPRYRPDIQQHEPKFEMDDRFVAAGMRSDYVVPLIVEGECIGTLNNGASKVDGISEWDRQLLVLLAPRLAQALRNANLHEALQESEERLWTLLDLTPAGIVVIDTETHVIVQANAAALEMFGASPDQVIGSVCHTYICPVGETKCPITDLGQTIDNSERVLLTADGKRVPVLKTVTSVMLNGRKHLLESFIDITERKQTEESLHRSAEETARGQRLLLALSHAAQAVQRARTPKEVYQNIGDEIAKLGYYATIFTVTDGRTHLVVSYLSFAPTLVQMAEKLTGLSAHNYRFPLKPGGFYYRVLSGGKAIFTNPGTEPITEALPKIAHPLAGRLANLLGLEQAIYAPMRGGNGPCCLLAVLGRDLTETDVPAMSAFAGQAAIALENARLYQESQREIAERKRAEKERERLLVQIREQAHQVQQIIDTVPEGVLLLNIDGQTLLANPVAEKALSLLTDAQIGDTLTHLGDRLLEELLASPHEGPWHEIETDGKTFEINAQPVKYGSEPENWVMVINDVTREREIQQRVQQQARLAAVGQLAAGIAHDFNNIMATVVLYAQMTAQAEDVSDTIRERMATINQQAEHATNLIQQILDFGRQAMLQRQPLDLLTLLKDQVNLLQRTLPESIEIELTYDMEEYAAPLLVHADPTRMQQMVTNLAVNARDAMPQGGNLHIGLERMWIEGDETAPLPEMEAGDWVRMIVSDTGVGIAPDVLSRIYEPFFTTRAPLGSGLGLAQVHGIVAQHEGHIDVESQIGEGTTFTIYLPILPDHPSGSIDGGATLDLPALDKGQKETILVVADDANIRQVLVESLEMLDYQTLEAANDQEALTLLEQYQEQIALVLNDVGMPNVEGTALLHTLKKRGSTVAVVLLTNYPLEKKLDLGTPGTIDWLLKPLDLDQLAKVVARALKKDTALLTDARIS